MSKVTSFFFDEEEKEILEDYKHLGILATISLLLMIIL